MEIMIEELFVQQLQKCPSGFQQKFRKIYQQLKVVDKPAEVKGIVQTAANKNHYKLYIDESRIGLAVRGRKLYIVCFLYNQYFH